MMQTAMALLVLFLQPTDSAIIDPLDDTLVLVVAEESCERMGTRLSNVLHASGAFEVTYECIGLDLR